MADFTEADGTPKGALVYGRDTRYLIGEQFIGGSVSMSTSQLSQVTFSYREVTDRWPTLSSGLVNPSNGSTGNVNDATLDIGPLRLQIGTLSVAPLGQSAKVTLEARSLGGSRMKVNKESSTLSRLSYSQWVRLKVESLGMKFVGEGSPVVELSLIHI